MKNCYMPTKHYANDIEFGSCWFESKLRAIRFRNQYGEQFIFVPRRGAKTVFIAVFIIGLLTGRFLLPLI